MSGEEQRKNQKAGSSLTDAVAAALASVDEPAAPEAGCASTQAQASSSTPPSATGGSTPSSATGGSTPPSATGGKAPPAVVGGSGAPPMVQPGANGAPKTNGAGFRSGPGSFADLMRRWDAGQVAPVTAGAEPAAETEDDAPSAPPPEVTEPAKADEPAKVEEAEAAAEPAAAAKPAPTKAREPIQVTYYGRTDVGLVREHNEDNFTVADLGAKLRDSKNPREATVSERGLILAVCDGMGGAAAGEVASQMAVDTIYDTLSAVDPPADRDEFARRLVRSIEEAGHRIFSAAKMDRTRRGMGTTTTLAGLVDNVLFVGQVGDSRAYVLRGDQFEQVTKDQSLVNQLIEAGQLTEDEAEAFEHSNIILQALGTTEDVTVDLTFLEMRKGDRLLLCSDGLSGLVHAEMMKEVLQETKELPEAAQKLIQMANAGGGHDNITVILADFDGVGLSAPGKAKVVYQQYPLPPDESDAERGAGAVREPSMKAGASKPGADVKRDGDYVASPSDEVPGARSGSSMALLAVGALLLVVALVVAGVLLMGEGETTGEAPAPDPVPTPVVEPEPPIEEPIEEPVEEPVEPPVAAQGTIVVNTDIEGAHLFVNDEDRGVLTDGMELTLAPNAYRIEARDGTNVVDSESVQLDEDGRQSVRLEMPAGVEPTPAPTETAPPRPRPRPVRPPRPRPTPQPLGGPSPSPTPRPLGGPAPSSTPENPF